MELKEAIFARHSVRGYTAQPVPQEVLREVLRMGTRAVSGVNCQPWEIAVATGDVLEQLKARNMECVHTGAPMDRIDPDVPKGVYLDRSRTIGKALLGAMNIPREDREGRIWWGERGFRFFDAPAVIFLLMDKQMEETAYRFDVGCLAQNICLAAMEYGLGTCVADQAIRYQRGIRQLLHVPEDKIMVTGIAIGYPDDTFPANQVVSQREPLSSVSTWYGFA